jgi:hypothetical protein
LCSSSSVCSLVFFPVLPVLSLLRRNSCCCCGVRWRPVWGYVDREGCFGCMEEMAERGEWPGGGLVLGALSLSFLSEGNGNEWAVGKSEMRKSGKVVGYV